MTIQICIGSSCHIKGSEELVQKLRQAINEHGYQGRVDLKGSFCMGRCNRQGVTVAIDGKIIEGVRPDAFAEFFRKNVMEVLEGNADDR